MVKRIAQFRTDASEKTEVIPSAVLPSDQVIAAASARSDSACNSYLGVAFRRVVGLEGIAQEIDPGDTYLDNI